MAEKRRSVLVRILKVALVLFLLVVAWVVVEAARGPVEPVEEHRVLTDPLPARVARPAAEPGAGRTPAALRVRIALEEGQFVVHGGGTAGTVRVDAQYDTAAYTLETALEDGPDGVPDYAVRFRRRISAVRALLSAARYDEVDSRVEVVLPEGVPLDLTLRLDKGEHRVDLSGLSIVRLTLLGSMGEVDLAFDRPNPVELDALEVEASMGEFTLVGLGHANARRVDVRGTMGELHLGFEGEQRADSDVTVRVRMGSATLAIPEGRPVQVVDRSNLLGEVAVRRRFSEDASDPGLEPGPRLRLDLGVRLGELSVR